MIIFLSDIEWDDVSVPVCNIVLEVQYEDKDRKN